MTTSCITHYTSYTFLKNSGPSKHVDTGGTPTEKLKIISFINNSIQMDHILKHLFIVYCGSLFNNGTQRYRI